MKRQRAKLNSINNTIGVDHLSLITSLFKVQINL
jgi:hypothetical protein